MKNFTESEMEQARVARRAYDKKWRAANPDKVRAYRVRAWLNRATREEAARKETDGATNE
jgi:hypothetical protein